MLIILFGILASVFFLTTCIGAFYLYRFSRIIFLFEDDLSNALNSLNSTEKTLNETVNMQVFFDSPEVRKQYNEAIQEVQVRRSEILDIIDKFTQRSKRKYIIVEEEEEPEEEQEEQLYQQQGTLPGHPPGAPNMMNEIYKSLPHSQQQGRNANEPKQPIYFGRSRRQG